MPITHIICHISRPVVSTRLVIGTGLLIGDGLAVGVVPAPIPPVSSYKTRAEYYEQHNSGYNTTKATT